ncbi:MAG: hypothetical protein IT204_07925 [Fimbriimonadaceae bacterium]|nr:hypothetical protein [Fimbriimonadaceae bacterium]
MVILYLLLLIGMMFIGGMLIQLNPAPLEYRLALFGSNFVVQSSILELIGYSMLLGAAVMTLPYLRVLLSAGRARRRQEQEAARLEQDNQTLRRAEAEQRTAAALLEARAAAAEEKALRLEAETRLLLTTRGNPLPPPRAPAASRWRKR